FYRDYDFVDDRYSRLEPLKRFIVFCIDGGGEPYGWDPEDIRNPKAREYGIYTLPRHGEELRFLTASFPQFIFDYCLSPTWEDGTPKEHLDFGPFHKVSRGKVKRPPRNPIWRRPLQTQSAPRQKLDERALLLDIVHHPDEQAPIRTYADWLAEKDDD